MVEEALAALLELVLLAVDPLEDDPLVLDELPLEVLEEELLAAEAPDVELDPVVEAVEAVDVTVVLAARDIHIS